MTDLAEGEWWAFPSLSDSMSWSGGGWAEGVERDRMTALARIEGRTCPACGGPLQQEGDWVHCLSMRLRRCLGWGGVAWARPSPVEFQVRTVRGEPWIIYRRRQSRSAENPAT